MSRYLRGGGPDVNGNGEVAQRGDVVVERVGGCGGTGCDAHRVRPAKRQPAVTGEVDRGTSMRTRDVRRRDCEWRATERVRKAQPNHRPADGDVEHLTERAPRQPRRGGHIARLDQLRRCGPSAEPVWRVRGVNNWS